MDALKKELERKRKKAQAEKAELAVIEGGKKGDAESKPDASSEGPARKWRRRGDYEREMIRVQTEEEEKREKERREKEAIEKAKKEKEDAELKEKEAREKERKEEEEAAKLKITPAQVIAKLRALEQPIRLFGETDAQRIVRWRRLEVQKPENMEGAVPEYHDVEETVEEAEKRKKAEEALHKLADKEAGTKHGMVLGYFKSLLEEWEASLAARPDEIKQSYRGKQETTIMRQAQRECQPLFKLLATKQVMEDILEALTVIMNFMKQGEFVKAHDAYVSIAIGNAAWPMGVTMVGIHERSGREKIFSSKVAHVLNDETQRKYLQSVKRIMTWAQKHFKADPSKCVR